LDSIARLINFARASREDATISVAVEKKAHAFAHSIALVALHIDLSVCLSLYWSLVSSYVSTVEPNTGWAYFHLIARNAGILSVQDL